MRYGASRRGPRRKRGNPARCDAITPEVTDTRYELIVAPSAPRQLSETLPEAVAVAAFEFIAGRCSTTRNVLASDFVRHSMIDTAPAEAPTAFCTESMRSFAS